MECVFRATSALHSLRTDEISEGKRGERRLAKCFWVETLFLQIIPGQVGTVTQ